MDRAGRPSVAWAIALYIIGGCVSPNNPTVESQNPEAPADSVGLMGVQTEKHDPNEGPRAVFSRPMQRLIVQFRVHLITAPSGTFNKESRLWTIAAEPMPDASAALRLNSNGFRAAIGRESDRQALMEFLDDTDGVRMNMDEAMPNLDKPVIIEIGACPPWQSVFHYDRKGSLRGADFVDAVARLLLRFELRSTNLKEVWLRVTPEVEEPPGPAKWQRDQDGELREMPQERKHTFVDIETEARIPEGGFLVLGASPTVAEAPVLGRVFFREPEPSTEKVAKTPRDRIYIISPIIRYSEDLRSRGGS